MLTALPAGRNQAYWRVPKRLSGRKSIGFASPVMKSFRVLIVDDHLLVRNGLRQVLAEEYRGVVFGEARTADEALTQVAKHAWDLVVLDIGIPGQDGFYVLQETLQRRPRTRVLMLSIHADPPYAARARQLGACGYLSKDAGRSDLVKAFRNVLAGRAHFDSSLPHVSAAPAAPGQATLSAREHKVLLAFAAGKRTGEIAAELSLSIKTISTYKRRLLNKLHLTSTADLVHYVIDHQLS
jgi:DNA-binding NarL/FixJ family response regulator